MDKVFIGMKYGRLTVIDTAPDAVAPSGRKSKRWLCQCDCGNQSIVYDSSLRTGGTKSCGCLRREVAGDKARTHGLSHSRLRNVWRLMLERCTQENNKSYYLYGGKGITVCDEWHNFLAFAEWSFANGYKDGLTIDRIDSNKNYCPENCRWVTRKVQNNNTNRNHLITWNGRTQTMAQWAEETGLPYSTIKSRINKHGWDIGRALSTPVMR